MPAEVGEFWRATAYRETAYLGAHGQIKLALQNHRDTESLATLRRGTAPMGSPLPAEQILSELAEL